jgi:hypothetical protein
VLPCCHGPPALPMLVRPECRCQSIVNIAQCAGAHASSRCTRRASSRCTRRASVGQAVDARVGDAVDARVGQASGKQSMHASGTQSMHASGKQSMHASGKRRASSRCTRRGRGDAGAGVRRGCWGACRRRCGRRRTDGICFCPACCVFLLIKRSGQTRLMKTLLFWDRAIHHE